MHIKLFQEKQTHFTTLLLLSPFVETSKMIVVDPESNNVHFLAEPILSEPLLTRTHDTRSTSAGTSHGGVLSTVFHMLLASAGFLLVSSLVFAFTRGRVVGHDHNNSTPPGNSSSIPSNATYDIFLLRDVRNDDSNSRFEVLVELFVRGGNDKNVSQEAVLRDESTPQHAALNWLANEDLGMLDLDTTPGDILIERFVMALLYVSTGGWDWSFPMRFLRDTGVCDWYDYEHERGIICNEDQTYVTEINIGTSNVHMKKNGPMEYFDFTLINCLYCTRTRSWQLSCRYHSF
jgi:hypothetical protein